MFINIPIKFSHLNVDSETDQDVLSKLNDSDGLLTQVKLIDKSEQGHCKSSHGIFILIVRAEHFTFLKATTFSHNSKKNGK